MVVVMHLGSLHFGTHAHELGFVVTSLFFMGPFSCVLALVCLRPFMGSLQALTPFVGLSLCVGNFHGLILTCLQLLLALFVVLFVRFSHVKHFAPLLSLLKPQKTQNTKQENLFFVLSSLSIMKG